MRREEKREGGEESRTFPFPRSLFRPLSALLCVVALILFLGLLTLFSATSGEALDHSGEGATYAPLLRQLLCLLIGALAGYLCFFLGARRVLAWSPLLLALTLVALALLFVPGLGREVNGSKRWLTLFAFSFQPSEVAQFFIPPYLIHLSFKRGGDRVSWSLLLKMAAPPLLALFLLLLEPNNGGAALLLVTLFVAAPLLPLPLRYWALPLFAASLVLLPLAWRHPYVQARLRVYLHPESDRLGRGHQPYQAKVAAGSGGLLGKGAGQSWQKLSYLPEAQNDYIAAIFAEEYGFIGISSLIALYALFTLFGIGCALTAEESEELALAGSYSLLIGLQAFINLAIVSGLLPTTGMNLPFFSQGGTSLVINLCAVGTICSTAKALQLAPRITSPE